MREILLIGGGGHARSVLSSLLAAAEKVAGIIDMKEKLGEKILGVSVIGTDEDLPALLGKGYEAIITVGSIKENNLRATLYEKVRKAGFRMATFVSRTAIIGKNVSIGEGSVVLEGAVVNAGAKIGNNSIINTGSIVEHDAEVGNSVHIAPGALLGGGTRVGDGAFVGAGATIIHGIVIGPGAVVGAGSTVLDDVSGGVSVAGCPAKVIK